MSHIQNLAGNWESLVLFLAVIVIHGVEQITSFFLLSVPPSIQSCSGPCISLAPSSPSLPLYYKPHLESGSYMVTVNTSDVVSLTTFPTLAIIFLSGNLPFTYSLAKSCLVFVFLPESGSEPWSLLSLKSNRICCLNFSLGIYRLLPHIPSYLFTTYLTDLPGCFETCSKYLNLAFCFSLSISTLTGTGLSQCLLIEM